MGLTEVEEPVVKHVQIYRDETADLHANLLSFEAAIVLEQR